MIYFVQAGEDGPIKIGKSMDVFKRISQLQTSNHRRLRLLWKYSGSEFSEADIHKKFSCDRIRGEWFAPSEELKLFIADLENSIDVWLENGDDEPITISEYQRGIVLISGFFGDIYISKDGSMIIEKNEENKPIVVNTCYPLASSITV